MVVVCQKSDFFIEEADEWRPFVWSMIKERKDLHFTIMTRRANRIKNSLPNDWGVGYFNVTLTLSVSTREEFLSNMPLFLEVNAKEKTLMFAPLLDEINLLEVITNSHQISYINAGGENYSNARPIYLTHLQKLSEDSFKLGIPFYFFDTGAYLIKDNKKYFIPQDKRHSQAFLSNLSHN